VFGATLGVAVIGSVYASLYASRLTARIPAHIPTVLARGAHDSIGAALTIAGRLAAAGRSTLGAQLHDAASSAFFQGYRAGCLVAVGVSAAGAALAAILLPAQPTTPALESAKHPMPVKMMICLAGCQSSNAAVHHHHPGPPRRDALRRFYSTVLGWEAASIGSEYTLTAPPGARVIAGDGDVTFYVEVNDVERTLRAAARLGGQRVDEKASAPGGRSATLLRDPEGYVVGLVASPRSV
jgi:predicted enzyme related to lactoylglutathione lyase